MTAQIYSRAESPAEDAFNIALDFLERAGAVYDEMPVYVFLAREITRLLDRGVKIVLKLTNTPDSGGSKAHGKPCRHSRAYGSDRGGRCSRRHCGPGGE